jgi:hypothetical protein
MLEEMVTDKNKNSGLVTFNLDKYFYKCQLQTSQLFAALSDPIWPFCMQSF